MAAVLEAVRSHQPVRVTDETSETPARYGPASAYDRAFGDDDRAGNGDALLAQIGRALAEIDALNAAATRTVERHIEAIRRDWQDRDIALAVASDRGLMRVSRLVFGDRWLKERKERLRAEYETEIASVYRRHEMFVALKRERLEQRLRTLLEQYRQGL